METLARLVAMLIKCTSGTGERTGWSISTRLTVALPGHRIAFFVIGTLALLFTADPVIPRRALPSAFTPTEPSRADTVACFRITNRGSFAFASHPTTFAPESFLAIQMTLVAPTAWRARTGTSNVVTRLTTLTLTVLAAILAIVSTRADVLALLSCEAVWTLAFSRHCVADSSVDATAGFFALFSPETLGARLLAILSFPPRGTIAGSCYRVATPAILAFTIQDATRSEFPVSTTFFTEDAHETRRADARPRLVLAGPGVQAHAIIQAVSAVGSGRASLMASGTRVARRALACTGLSVAGARIEAEASVFAIDAPAVRRTDFGTILPIFAGRADAIPSDGIANCPFVTVTPSEAILPPKARSTGAVAKRSMPAWLTHACTGCGVAIGSVSTAAFHKASWTVSTLWARLVAVGSTQPRWALALARDPVAVTSVGAVADVDAIRPVSPWGA